MKSILSKRYRYVILLCWVLIAMTLYLHLTQPQIEQQRIEFAKNCFLHKRRNASESITMFDDLLTAKQPKYDRNIFFIESECFDSGIVKMRPRHACSIETAAKSNPNRDIYVIFLSPVGLPQHEKEWSSTIKALMTYPNIHLRTVQLKKLCANTPIEQWIETDAFFKSEHRTVHASDLVRLLLLYKFGGTYLDMDYMMMEPLDAIPRNWVAFQSHDLMANAAFDFRHSGIGHIAMHDALRDITVSFTGSNWGHNGPYLMLRVMQRMCGSVEEILDLEPEECRGIKVYLPDLFYPFHAYDLHKIFDANKTAEMLAAMDGVMGFHWWNSGTRNMQFVMRDGDAYDLIAAKHCPQIHDKHREF